MPCDKGNSLFYSSTDNKIINLFTIPVTSHNCCVPVTVLLSREHCILWNVKCVCIAVYLRQWYSGPEGLAQYAYSLCIGSISSSLISFRHRRLSYYIFCPARLYGFARAWKTIVGRCLQRCGERWAGVWQPCSKMRVFNAWLRGHAIPGEERQWVLMLFHLFLTCWSVYLQTANPRCVTEGCCWLSFCLQCESCGVTRLLVLYSGAHLNDTESR